MPPQTVPLMFDRPIVRLQFRQVERDTPVLVWEALARQRTYLTALTAVMLGLFPETYGSPRLQEDFTVF